MGSLSGLKLVEVTANFLRGDAFAKPVSAFVERECLVFDTPSSGAAGGDSGEGYEHALMDVQVAYAKLVSDLLEKHLSGVGAGWDKLQAACLNHQRAPATSVVRNALSCCSDFAAFFDLMAEANLELEARALELWHMQTQFGFDDDDLAAEAELGDSIAPLPSNETLRRDYGLSEATVRELEAARAELGGGEGLVAKLGSLMSALDDEPDPLAAALAAAEPPPVAPSLLTRRGSGARGVPAIALDAPRPSASAPPTTNSAMAQHDAPAIHVTATESLTTAAARAARAAATAAAGAPPKSLHVSGPPSPTQEQSPTSSTVGLERPALSAKPRHVPALKTAGPLSAPAKQSHVAESPRVSKPGDPDYDENTTLTIGNSRWKIGRQIGRGATARVFLAVDMELHRTFAVKQMLTGPGASSAESAALRELEREIAVMKRLSHPNLVTYLGTERTADELYIAMEYVRGGALADLIKRIAAQQGRQRQQRAAADAAAAEAARAEGLEPPPPTALSAPQIVLPLRTIASYTAQVFNGLAYLHAQDVIHRDIKSANILVDATYQHVKIADFGSSRVLEPLMEAGIMTEGDGAQTLKGTPFWMSPEVISGSGYGRKADVWSVGCVCIEMLTGRPPWSSQLGDKAHAYAIMYHIVNATDPPDYPSGLPAHINGAMALMFERDTSKRPSAQQMLELSWLRDALPADQPPPPSALRSAQHSGADSFPPSHAASGPPSIAACAPR